MAKHIQWISDEAAKKLLAEGLWSLLIYRGLLGFGITGVVILSVIGLIKDGVQTFETAWWREGSLWILIAGLVGAGALWLILRLPTRLRDIVCWILLIAVVGFLGWTLY